MHAFSEILLAPPAVEVLRTEEPRSAWQRRPLPVRPPMRSSSATRIESSMRRWRHRLRLHEAKGLRVALLRPHARSR